MLHWKIRLFRSVVRRSLVHYFRSIRRPKVRCMHAMRCMHACDDVYIASRPLDRSHGTSLALLIASSLKVNISVQLAVDRGID